MPFFFPQRTVRLSPGNARRPPAGVYPDNPFHAVPPEPARTGGRALSPHGSLSAQNNMEKSDKNRQFRTLSPERHTAFPPSPACTADHAGSFPPRGNEEKVRPAFRQIRRTLRDGRAHPRPGTGEGTQPFSPGRKKSRMPADGCHAPGGEYGGNACRGLFMKMRRTGSVVGIAREIPHVFHGTTGLLKHLEGRGRTSAGTAENEHGLSFRHFVHAAVQFAHRNMKRAGRVPHVEFPCRSHIEKKQAVFVFLKQRGSFRRGNAARSGPGFERRSGKKKAESQKQKSAITGKTHVFSLRGTCARDGSDVEERGRITRLQRGHCMPEMRRNASAKNMANHVDSALFACGMRIFGQCNHSFQNVESPKKGKTPARRLFPFTPQVNCGHAQPPARPPEGVRGRHHRPGITTARLYRTHCTSAGPARLGPCLRRK